MCPLVRSVPEEYVSAEMLYWQRIYALYIAENVGSYRGVEITPQYQGLPSKEMTGESPVTSPALARRSDLNGHEAAAFHEQILQLKKQQQLQQQILLQHFQVQQQQLAEQHEQQLRHHLKELWEKQKAAEEQEREAREKERLDSLKKKGKHEQSAVASSEVKQKLQGFLLNKKQREAAAAAANGAAPTPSGPQPYRNWSVVQQTPAVENPPGQANPYRLNPLLTKYEDEYPLRKTASEPNLLKTRLKQRVFERRASPIARRKDRHLKRKSTLAMESGSSNPDSGPNSPPVHATQLSPPAGHTTPIQEEGEPGYGQTSGQSGSLSDVSALYSSPSMPNISLGRPPNSAAADGNKLASVSEAEVRAAFAARLGMPLTGQMLPGTLPFYPTLPVIDAEYSNPTSPSYIQKQMQSLEQNRPHLQTIYHAPPPITDAQVAHARLNKAGHRPLGRTQSAPLPLGHPMLNTTQHHSTIVHYEDSYREQPSITSNLLKQQIRQTVLTRVGSRAQSLANAHLEHTPETDDTAEVIDLTEKSSRCRSQEEDQDGRMPCDLSSREENLQEQRDLMMRQGSRVIGRPLARALSSPLVALGPDSQAVSPKLTGSPQRLTTGLAFDSGMLKHACICGENGWHPEHGGRLQSVWARLCETGLTARCARVRSRKATLEEIQTCHSEPHTLLFGTNPLNRQKLDMSKLSQLPIKSFVRLPCGGVGVDSDTTWNDIHTAPAARMAVGSVVDLAFKTAAGDIRNGFAVVRPPGHHAEISQAMGFCFFNSVAIATKLLQQKLDVRRILIIDWDVHHGNGTQQMFYEDRRVLFISLHRHDDGNFFPGTGGPTECGLGPGLGYTVNIAWSGGLNPPMGDAEYLAAFRTVVMPIARDFCPDLVMVSAGFDAAHGHPAPLGGYKLSPAIFGWMTQQLMQLADGKVVLSLEGGYDLPAICDSAEECVKALLGDEPSPISHSELIRPPCQNAIDTLQKTIAIQLSHWPCLKELAHTVSYPELPEAEESVVTATMASLSMQHQNSHLPQSETSHEGSVEPMEEDEVK
ncbi:histone deacetylase 4 isoform X4 [Halyomorpha halys]|uniref:histone deacetylase 4 isoform X4 n=1 Tax=Halyomorpha halys TaxID=286706 RepID=UPI0006D4E7F8|nr:histone deacetylase 4 isoform X4 [Halyomorpha halys]